MKLQNDLENNFIFEEEIPEHIREMLIWLYKEQNKTLKFELQQKRRETFANFYKLISELLINDFGVNKLNIKEDASFSKDLGLNRQSLLNLIDTITKISSCSFNVQNIDANITITDLIRKLAHLDDD